MTDFALVNETTATIPSHVPPELIFESDFYTGGMTEDPFGTVAWQQTGPRIFYTPTHYLLPGSWVVTRAADIREVLQDTETFSSKGQVSFSALIDEAWDLIPVEVDPPMHTLYRNLLNPLFSPREIGKIEAAVKAVAANLADEMAEASEVEFIDAFAKRFPIYVFLQLMGMPLDKAPQFLAWEKDMIKAFDLGKRKVAARAIITYLRGVIEERKVTQGEDLISRVIHAKIEGRGLTDNEIIGICFLLFLGGLDTVTASIGFHFNHLAQDPELQEKLRQDRSLIPVAIEEMLRLYSIVVSHRRVTKDTVLAGVQLKAGDWMSVPTVHASRDATEFDNPNEFILDRPNNRHVAFAYGPHRCLGSHLARREFIVAMNEIFDRLPPFRKKEGAPFRTAGGTVFAVEELHLVFDKQRPRL